MERRKFLVGLGSASIGGSALVGSGAFSRVESQRAVTIQVAEDPDAYLGMAKCRIDGSETPNSSFAHLDSHGHLEILMNPDNPTIGESPLGEGINSDSRMWVDNVFQLCNYGKEDVCIYIEDDDDWPRAPEAYDEERRVDFYLGGDQEGTIVGEENEFFLELGECVCIGLKTNSKGLSEGDEILEELDNEIRIIADVECAIEPEFPPEENGDKEPDPEDPDPRTIGFWSNWSGECTPGGQANYLGETLDETSGIELGDLTVTKEEHAESPNCGAVNLLLSRDLDGNVRANDGAYNLASQLLAAKLNRAAGADVPEDTDCGDIEDQIDAGQTLLADIGFDGAGSYLLPGTGANKRQDAIDIADCLDRYNNGEFTD